MIEHNNKAAFAILTCSLCWLMHDKMQPDKHDCFWSTKDACTSMPSAGDCASQETPVLEHNLIMQHDKAVGLILSEHALLSFIFFSDFDWQVRVIQLSVFGANVSFYDLVDLKTCLIMILRDKYGWPKFGWLAFMYIYWRFF